MATHAISDFELESMRRSLAMLQSNQLAVTRDQAMMLVAALIEARAALQRSVEQADDADS